MEMVLSRLELCSSESVEKISPRLVEIMQNWVHPGFSVFQGEAIAPDDHQARQRVAGYMVNVLRLLMF